MSPTNIVTILFGKKREKKNPFKCNKIVFPPVARLLFIFYFLQSKQNTVLLTDVLNYVIREFNTAFQTIRDHKASSILQQCTEQLLRLSQMKIGYIRESQTFLLETPKLSI